MTDPTPTTDLRAALERMLGAWDMRRSIDPGIVKERAAAVRQARAALAAPAADGLDEEHSEHHGNHIGYACGFSGPHCWACGEPWPCRASRQMTDERWEALGNQPGSAQQVRAMADRNARLLAPLLADGREAEAHRVDVAATDAARAEVAAAAAAERARIFAALPAALWESGAAEWKDNIDGDSVAFPQGTVNDLAAALVASIEKEPSREPGEER